MRTRRKPREAAALSPAAVAGAIALTGFGGAAAGAEAFAVCQSPDLLERVLAAPAQPLPEDCRRVTLRQEHRSGRDLCVIELQDDPGGLIDVFADVPGEWWTPCANLVPRQDR